jgi:hypothetical protein
MSLDAPEPYPSANPHIHRRGMIGESSPQIKSLEVTDVRGAIVAVEATGRHSSLVV